MPSSYQNARLGLASRRQLLPRQAKNAGMHALQFDDRCPSSWPQPIDLLPHELGARGVRGISHQAEHTFVKSLTYTSTKIRSW